MKSLSRDAKLAIGVVLLLVIVVVIIATQRKVQQQYPKLSTLSSAPDGALALKLWTQQLHYQVDEQVLGSFVPPGADTILFMLEPLNMTGNDLRAVDDWAEKGGTVIVIGEQYDMFSIAEHYKFSLAYLPDTTQTVALEAPLLLSPSGFDTKNATVRFALSPQRADYVALVTYQSQPVLVSFDQGKGRVILGTIPTIFTNAGLKESGDPELVLNILALAREKGKVWFDEWHHGLQNGTQINGPNQFLRRTPMGHALLFITFAVFIALLLQGRGFGRPVPLPQEIKRRGALEHITGVANLSRRAAHRSAVMMHYHDQIKRKLGQRYRLDSGMDDVLFVNILADYNPSLDKNEILDLLTRLKRRDVSESEMVHLAGEAAKWIDT